MMKYLLILLVVLVVLWFIGARSRRSRAPPRERSGKPQEIEACAHCGVHLPRAEMVVGERGLYCSEAHRLARGDRR